MRFWNLALLAGLLTACASTGPGAPRPETSVDMDGLVLADLRGIEHDLGVREQVTVLVFWQTWCKSCLAEAPAVLRAEEARPELAFYGVVSGPDDAVNDDEVRIKSAQLGYGFPQLRDRDVTLTQRLGVVVTPTLIVIDRSGGVLYRGHEVPRDWDSILSAVR